MNDINDIDDIDDIDDIGRRAGAAAKRRAQRSIEVRHGLDELRSVSRARTQMYRVEPDDARRMTPRAWVRFGSAIAVAAAVLVAPARDHPIASDIGCRNTASDSIEPKPTQVISAPAPTTTQP